MIVPAAIRKPVARERALTQPTVKPAAATQSAVPAKPQPRTEMRKRRAQAAPVRKPRVPTASARKQRRLPQAVRKRRRAILRQRPSLRRRKRRLAAAPPEMEATNEPSSSSSESGTYAEGLRAGTFLGGEGLLEARLPADLLIPDLTLDEVLTAGIEAIRHRGIPLLPVASVYEEIERALAVGQPYSLVRLGDGELLTMAQDVVLPAGEVAREGKFLAYAGLDAPDLRARDEVASAVRKASRIGVPLSRRPHFQPLLFAVWKAFGLRLESIPLTISTVNYSLHEQGYLSRLMAGRRILLIGDVAEPLAIALQAQGIRVAGAIHPVRGMGDWQRAVEEAAGYDFDLALVSAGIAAVPICVNLAERSGKAAIDFGHMANRIAGVKAAHVREE